jgi:hypothetical protein
VDTSSDTDFNIWLGLTLLKRAVCRDDFGDLILDIEFVRIRVWALGLAELIDGSRTYLKVLLRLTTTPVS